MKPKLNHQIKSFEVRVTKGPETGVMTHTKAMQIAGENGMDLIEISGTATPPACVIEELGKWKYDQAKKEKASKQVVLETKTIQLRPVTEPGDLQTKARHANEFLADGHRVNVLMRFRGRELAHPEEGTEVINTFVALCTNGQLEGKISNLEGRSMTCTLVKKKG